MWTVAASGALGGALFWLVVLVPLAAWFGVRVVYQPLRARKMLLRARSSSAADPDLDDDELLRISRAELDRLAGERPVRDRVLLEQSFGASVSEWVLSHAPSYGEPKYRVKAGECDPIRVLDRSAHGATRVVVRVTVQVSIVGLLSVQRRHAIAYWTYSNSTGSWARGAVESRWGGRRHLAHAGQDAPALEERLHNEAVIEQSASETAPNVIAAGAGDVIGAKDATAAARDIAAVDQRYAPAVIQACVSKVLAGWELATNGEPEALNGLATAQAIHEILHPSRWVPTVIREPRIKSLQLVELDPKSDRTYVVVSLTISAQPAIRRYTAYWRLVLTDEPELPWQLESTRAWKDSYQFKAV
jgi:hypothetical protein